LLKALKGGDGVHALAFGPDGRTLYAALAHGAVRAWSVASGEPVVGTAWPNTTPQALVVDPAGRTLAGVLADATVRLWDIAGREELHVLRGHSGAVLGLAYSPDGKTLATAGADRTVRLWDAEAGQPRATLEGHSSAVLAVAFSPDGRKLASAGADRVVKLWNGAEGQQVVTTRGHTDQVDRLAFSPDAKALASADSDKAVLLREIDRPSAHARENPLAASLFNPSHRRRHDELVRRTRDTRTILSKLEEPISMSFQNETPLDVILKYIKSATMTPSFSGIPIYVDPIGLQEAEKTVDSTVALDIEGIPLKATLPLLLKQLGLTYRVADGRLTITSIESGGTIFGATLDTMRRSVNLDNPRVRRILSALEEPISMVFNEPTPLDEVLKYIRSATSTESYPGIPIYVDPIGLQEAEKSLMSVITYKAKGIPLRRSLREMLWQLGLSYFVGDEVVMITSTESRLIHQSTRKAWTTMMLEEPVELSFTKPTALSDVIEAIGVATKGPNDIGLWISLPGFRSIRSGHEGSLKVIYQSKGKPLRQSLKEMLTPLELVYEVDSGRVVIMPKDEAEKLRETRRLENQLDSRTPE
jgi:hypothetical protein